MKKYIRKVNKVDEFPSKWKNSKSKIKTKEKEKKLSKTRQQKESNKSKTLQYILEETNNDKEPMTELLYRESESESESEPEDSEYDIEEDENSGEDIKKTSSETKIIDNKPPIKCISNIPPTKRILLTI